ncbi:peptide-N4-asparagine amidase [Lysobacter sp. CA199]|uniref:peptide-N4-asparagine amidase n=1 Tax=Lysobacter sp. CA199 TaxID=3455608 RepID=UPI003F8D045C
MLSRLAPRLSAIALGLLCLNAAPLLATAAFATGAPAAEEFGTDWDDPRTADPTVARPATRSCTVEILDTAFADFEWHPGTIAPPADCPGPWSKVVLEMDGQVKGVQFDRLGYLQIGGLTVLSTSTPEPSRDGIGWHVEKDISDYASLLKSPQAVRMYLGNVVNQTYTGVIYVQARVVFYNADRRHPAVDAADQVAPLANEHRDGSDLIGDYTLPANATRWIGEVYATGSGGGCEEFWYFTAPPEANYSCPAQHGPYREVQVLIDGRVAGIAMPYPHIYTGGWSNPFLWYVIPAPRAFNIEPIRYDLSPFIGLVNDGRAHEVRFRVANLPDGASGWTLQPNLQAWTDARRGATGGRLLSYELTPLAAESKYRALPDGRFEVDTRGGHRLRATGYVDTSKGRQYTTVERIVGNTNLHGWGAEENPDGVKGEWNDTQTVARIGRGLPSVSTHSQRFGFDGSLSVVPSGSAQRIVTTMKIVDDADTLQTPGQGQPAIAQSKRNRFEGQAGWNYGVPRPERHATGHSSQRHRSYGTQGCYDHEIAQRNGFIGTDRYRCGKP